jgi:hypothetical protein
MDRKLLGVYLNDHLAGSTLASELARRSAGSNRGTELGAFLERFVDEVAEDRSELIRLMEGLGIRPDPVKRVLAWTGEKVGRLKLNGRLLSYSPLSRLLELETLRLGVEGKLALWLALRHAGFGDELARIDLVRLTQRARDQRTELERRRLAAAREAFAAP